MKTLVIAPHPDDEILGVGGTLLKRKSQGHSLAWAIVTKPSNILGWNDIQKGNRDKQICLIKNQIGFDKLYQLDFPAAKLNQTELPSLINSISEIIKEFAPEEIFFPHIGDVHTDHEIVHKAIISSTKSFRNHFLKRLIVYETLSETEFCLDKTKAFFPNLYIDISRFLDQKIKLLNIYSSEVDQFPFPRSEESVMALAKYRGSSSNCLAAEAFQILKQIE